MAELEALSKLKLAGKLHFWRGTIEIPEDELHAICDEIQAEHDRAISALNKAAGNWAKADAELRELLDDVAKGINCYPRERITGYLDWNITTAEAVMLDVRDRLRELLGGEGESDES